MFLFQSVYYRMKLQYWYFATLNFLWRYWSADILDYADVLGALKDDVSTRMDAQKIASHMYQCKALTEKEMQSIYHKRKKPFKAAKKLLDIVRRGPRGVFGFFLAALKNTGHQQVHDHVVSCGCTGRLWYLCHTWNKSHLLNFSSLYYDS